MTSAQTALSESVGGPIGTFGIPAAISKVVLSSLIHGIRKELNTQLLSTSHVAYINQQELNAIVMSANTISLRR